jgi:hypothetical protein
VVGRNACGRVGQALMDGPAATDFLQTLIMPVTPPGD